MPQIEYWDLIKKTCVVIGPIAIVFSTGYGLARYQLSLTGDSADEAPTVTLAVDEASSPSQATQQPQERPGASAPEEIEFTRNGEVRCPGGGDWLGRERNRRSDSTTYEAPDGYKINEVHVRTLRDNDGSHGSIQTTEVDGATKSATISFSCDPDNHPGAGGGWMEVQLYGTISKIEPS